MRILAAPRDWGTLGEPVDDVGSASLLHVIKTDAAILRHGFYETGAVVPPHRHDGPTITYTVGGPCIESGSMGQAMTLRLMFHPARHGHSLQFDGPTHILAIELIGRDNAPWPLGSVELPATLYGDVWHVAFQIVHQSGTASIEEALDRLIEHALAYCSRSGPTWLLSVIDSVHSAWQDVPSATDLARRASISRQHLCRTFKTLTGVTIRQYGVMLRLDHARGLLWGTDMPLADVAAETGFATRAISPAPWSNIRERRRFACDGLRRAWAPSCPRCSAHRKGWPPRGSRPSVKPRS